MKTGYFAHLALVGVKNNRKFYLPYILTCVGMVMMQYIVSALPYAPAMVYMRGRNTLVPLLMLGKFVIALFSAIFLFYTHSFLMRRRKKEFGLYNILGMGKGSIARILIWETLLVGGISLAGGIAGGALFSKFAELSLSRLLDTGIYYELTFSMIALRDTFLAFALIFLVIFIWSVLQVKISSPIALIRSENAGEKAPRANWAMGLIGILVLTAAYYLACAVEDPLDALRMFFIAVLMVIVATYIILISGSVFFCRLLQKSKAYYYKARHFVSVSSMTYRMKRHGAGLASICVLATMVLVMMIASVSLYSGMNVELDRRYPRDFNISARMPADRMGDPAAVETLRRSLRTLLSENGIAPNDPIDYACLRTYAKIKGSVLDLSTANAYASLISPEDLVSVSIVPLSACPDANGQTLNRSEALLYAKDYTYTGDTFRIGDLMDVRIVGHADSFTQFNPLTTSVSREIVLFVPDFDDLMHSLQSLVYPNTDWSFDYSWNYAFDFLAQDDRAATSLLSDWLHSFFSGSAPILYGCHVESKGENRADFITVFGGLLFLGILLSIVFLSATVLIIYYKQVTEGYEDQARFEIMQKVGMTKRDIQASINSQMLTVFFLPLLLAVLHTGFAIPLLRRLFDLFGIVDLRLILMTGGLSVGVFTIFYALVYRITSNAYYNIVSGAHKA